MSNRAKTILLLIIDSLIFILSMILIISIRSDETPLTGYIQDHLELFTYVLPFWIFIYFIEGLYTLRTYNPAGLPVSVIRTTLISVIGSVLIIYLFPDPENRITPKTNLVLIALVNMPFFYFWRRLFFRFFSHKSRLRETVLFGSPDTLKMVLSEIERKPYLGYKIAQDINPATELVAIERNITKDSSLYQKIFNLLGTGVEVMDLAKFAEIISGKIPINAIDETWFVEYCGHQNSRSYDIIKNIFDRTLAFILLTILAPLAMITLPLLLLFHGRPLFFKQVRTGLNNKPFILFKLRTMVVDAEKHGAQWARPADARITKIGKFLRKTRLDELPQLLNILKGEMSLVGPRPERPEIIEKELAPHIPFYNLRHLVKPGVTGWAQVTFRYGFSVDDSKEKLQFDLYYVKNRSFWLDLIVFLKTIKTVLTGAGQ